MMKSIRRILMFVVAGLPILVMGQTPSLPQGDLSQRERSRAVKNWQWQDLERDGVLGISMERAKLELLKGKKARPVVVAVIDGGVDTDHEALKASVWINRKEKPGNGKDDDGNGYIDDVQGWNFMGSSKGSFDVDNTEMARQYRLAKLRDPNSEQTKKLKAVLDSVLLPQKEVLHRLEMQKKSLDALNKAIGKATPTLEEYKAYVYKNADEAEVLIWVVGELKKDSNFLKTFEANRQAYLEQTGKWNNPDYDPRAGNAEYEKAGYGNADSKGPNPFHGTMVSGLLAGYATIMPIRAVPNGDYLEKDMANAIRYAADNGARIINISISKFSSPEKKLIDDAVKYAMKKGLLIIHASGNRGIKLEKDINFPQREYADGGIAEAWLEVGASSFKDDAGLPAWFANYGERVDVYAPGVELYTALPGNKYGYNSGTSFAAPVVSALAATIWGYYPKLTAVQVKEIIMKSVVKRDALKDKCVTSGVVNAYSALKLAESYK